MALTDDVVVANFPKVEGANTVLPAAVSEIEARRRQIVRPLLVSSMAFYGVGLITLAYFPDVVATKIAGSINVAYVLALLQFAMTFLVAFVYARQANDVIDPLVSKTFAAMSKVQAPGAAS